MSKLNQFLPEFDTPKIQDYINVISRNKIQDDKLTKFIDDMPNAIRELMNLPFDQITKKTQKGHNNEVWAITSEVLDKTDVFAGRVVIQCHKQPLSREKHMRSGKPQTSSSKESKLTINLLSPENENLEEICNSVITLSAGVSPVSYTVIGPKSKDADLDFQHQGAFCLMKKSGTSESAIRIGNTLRDAAEVSAVCEHYSIAAKSSAESAEQSPQMD